MGYLQKQKKSSCPGCGANDILYQFASEYCPHCSTHIQYDEYCICTTNSSGNCTECSERSICSYAVLCDERKK